MLFPDSKRVIYKKNPLVEVICRLRFPTILRIRERHLSDFQEMVRKDYPEYSEKEPSFEIPPQMPKGFVSVIEQMNIPIPPGLTSYRFLTTDAKRFISLGDGFISLAETEYEKWESFREEMAKAEQSLVRVYEPALYSRVGLRYRDVISRKNLGLEGIGWQELLKPQMLGELGDEQISDNVMRIQTQVIIKIPDITDGQVVLKHGLVGPNGNDEECYLIDADFYIERKEGIDEPFKTLDKFNRMAGRLFRWG